MTIEFGSRRSVAAILLAMAGPIIWAVHFLAMYALIGIACARWPAELEIAGTGVRSAIIGSLTLLAFIGLGLALRQAAGGRRDGQPADQEFLDWLTKATGLLAGIGIVWSAVYGLAVQSCQ